MKITEKNVKNFDFDFENKMKYNNKNIISKKMQNIPQSPNMSSVASSPSGKSPSGVSKLEKYRVSKEFVLEGLENLKTLETALSKLAFHAGTKRGEIIPDVAGFDKPAQNFNIPCVEHYASAVKAHIDFLKKCINASWAKTKKPKSETENLEKKKDSINYLIRINEQFKQFLLNENYGNGYLPVLAALYQDRLEELKQLSGEQSEQYVPAEYRQQYFANPLDYFRVYIEAGYISRGLFMVIFALITAVGRLKNPLVATYVRLDKPMAELFGQIPSYGTDPVPEKVNPNISILANILDGKSYATSSRIGLTGQFFPLYTTGLDIMAIRNDALAKIRTYNQLNLESPVNEALADEFAATYANVSGLHQTCNMKILPIFTVQKFKKPESDSLVSQFIAQKAMPLSEIGERLSMIKNIYSGEDKNPEVVRANKIRASYKKIEEFLIVKGKIQGFRTVTANGRTKIERVNTSDLNDGGLV